MELSFKALEKEQLNIVWLKRDLRSQDHLPFLLAEREKVPYVALYLYEPDLMISSDNSVRHWRFCYQSIQSLNKTFSELGEKVEVMMATARDAFAFLHENYNLEKVFSYQESGTERTWIRDLRLNQFFQEKSIQWYECQRDGVQRGRQNRKDWDKEWYVHANLDIIENRFDYLSSIVENHPFQLSKELYDSFMKKYPDVQPGGEENAWKYLESFVCERGFTYHYNISKPAKSRKASGRISPYMAWGNLSSRQVYQFIIRSENYRSHKRAFNGMLARLKWRCHFTQKFEMQTDYEYQCLNLAYEAIERSENNEHLKLWKEGNTGVPMIDAAMRCLIKTGWINFRLRAMLVSFLCHHLNQDWRRGVYYIAKLFLDYDPGIHYPQFQMQASVTGINTIRIYNPVKLGLDHDKEAVFIKKWVPELRNLDSKLIHEPWNLTRMEQQFYGFELGKHYPNPMVNMEQAAREARERLFSFKKQASVKQYKQIILDKHTRRS